MQAWTNIPLVKRSQAFFMRHWVGAIRWRQKFVMREEVFHLVIASGVGVIGGLVNFFYFYALEYLKLLFLHHPGDPEEIAEMIAPWQRIAPPALGGLLAGLVLFWGLRLAGSKGTTNLLEAVVAGDGRLPFRRGTVKVLSSLVSIGTGASIGREGGITQLSATLASKWGQLAKWPPYRLRLLVGCGAASGIAAAYNAPIAGAVFAALIVLGNFSMNLFAPLVVSSVMATVVSRSLLGIKPLYESPAFEFDRVLQLPWFIVLGVLCGVLAAIFLKLLKGSEALFGRLKVPIYVKMAIGGLAVGFIAYQQPEVWGNGYLTTNRILHQQFLSESSPVQFLALLLLAKLLATVATVGSGAVGGVFTPTLYLGAALGALFGTILQHLGAAQGLPLTTFALVGMGGMLSATTRSPLLAMIMISEISMDYSLMPALMLGCVVSILVIGRLHQELIYTEELRARGVELAEGETRFLATAEQQVGDLMHPPVPPVRETTTFRQIAERFLGSSNNFLPVVDAQDRLIGVVALQDLKEFLNSGDGLDGVIAYDVMRAQPKCLTPNQRLTEALPTVLDSELRNIPVVNSRSENRLIGSLARAEVLALFAEAIAAGSKPAG